MLSFPCIWKQYSSMAYLSKVIISFKIIKAKIVAYTPETTHVHYTLFVCYSSTHSCTHSMDLFQADAKLTL